MKVKRMFSKIILSAICMLGCLSITASAKAATDTNLYLGLEEYRSSNLAYMTEERVMWKISSYDSLTSTTADKTRTIYCIKAGPGFGSSENMGGSGEPIIKRTYTKSFDLKNYDAIGAVDGGIYQAVLPSGEKYNSLVWLLEHCYVPAKNEQEEQAATEYRNKLLSDADAYIQSTRSFGAGISSSGISDDEIDIAQQLAVWYFTNDDSYKITNESFSLWVKSIQDSEYRALGDKFSNGDERNDAAIFLFIYLIENAEANKNVAPTANTNNTISIINTNVTIENTQGNYIVGPYKLETDSNDYELEASLTDKNGTALTYTILDSNKNTTTATLKDLELTNAEFYLSIPDTQNINGAKFSVSIKEYQTSLTYWSVAGANRVDQPVVEVERTKVEDSAEVEIPKYVEKTFDLALRKYITKVDGEPVTNTRVPNIDESTLATDKTATYKHRKDPVVVSNGTKVTYNITIYNEGEQKGYATKVVDQLPTGLKFNKVVSGNFDVLSYDENLNKVTFTRKSGIEALNAYDGNTLSSETIEIECEVTAKANTVSDQILTNVAWISEEYNSEKDLIITNQEEKDRDSEPSTAPNVNKDNMSNYTGNNNKADLTDSNNYYKGWQDDDDFEKLILEKEVANEYNLILVKEDENGEQLDSTATFVVNGETKTVTGRLEIVKNVPINETNVDTVDTYIIKETVPPDEYCEFDGTITIKVTKKNDNGTYKVDKVEYIVTDEDGNDITNATEDTVKVYVRNGNIYVEVKNYQFDMALRKYILKVNNKDVQVSRRPVISAETLENLNNGNIETATKEHTKNPLRVEIGDTVLYEIRVYNEGSMDGYVKEITDYLPEGLTLKENSTINNTYGWTNPSGDGKTIVSTKTANDLLKAFDGSTLATTFVQVECTVTAEASQNSQSLKNVAEITKATDKDGKEVEDRDSTPKNLTDSQKKNYNPGESEKGWGYEDDDDYEELLIPAKEFDLALRKFITNVNGKELVDSNGKYLREPTIDVSKLVSGESTTAEYKHQKAPVGVRVGDIVIYTLRIYNEGALDGYASSVTDFLPPELEFVTDDEENFNASYGWVVDSSLRKATTTKLAKTIIDPEENLIKAFNKNTMTEPDYVELKIKCRVKSTAKLYDVITNIAEITDFTDAKGNEVTDRDSQSDNVTLPTDENLPEYKGNTSNKSILTDTTYHYKGQQDDDDFEKLTIEEFDLALRKFITGVNDEKVTNRVPVFTKNINEDGNYIYEHTKEPIEVETTDIVEYTIRIFNEGNINGYAKEVKDDIPSGLEFLPNNDLNKEYRWVMLDEEGNVTEDVNKAVAITTDYLSKEQENETGRNNLIKAFNQDLMTSPDSRDVKVKFKVIAPSSYEGIITNVAEISDDSDENGNEIEDVDSTPNNNNMKEDDIDVEHIKLTYFDLALRKFITAVNEKEVTNRYPVFKIDENGNYVYEHTKEPVEVENGNIVTYTIRVYNEGRKAGYAKEVKDDLPEGLEYLPENDLNKEYRWVMLDENDEVTEDITKAVSIVTDYLSKEQEDESGRNNLLNSFDNDSMEEPDHRDVKIAFKVTEPNTSDRILINKAQISDDSDKDGKEVIDKDSTPDKWIEGEDDQDIEKVKVKYFDLALRKWVTQAIVIQDGKEVVTETGHKAEDDPEEVVKVEIVQSKLNKVVVKFKYKIRVTNEGEIAGYVDEISDYIPQGLKFVKADNPKWEEVEGKVVTDQLKDTLLQPGESAEVEILLTWINGKDNLGQKVNVAEISKDRNDSNSKDIDSTPNNVVPGEDDIDDAPVILTIKTGAGIERGYILLTIGAISIIVLGAVAIKKYVL